jgi:hypothetical protein
MRVRYSWLSVPFKFGAASCGSPLHFALAFNGNDHRRKPILVTEGALKADVVRTFFPNIRVVGSGGVSCSHCEIVSNSRFVSLIIAYDVDYLKNLHVSRSIARLLALRLDDSKRYKYPADVRILWWEGDVNGIDDALLKRLPVYSLNISEWLALLDETARKEAIQILFRRR